MNASQDRSNDPNIGERVLWLAQVSAAATALAGTRVPDQFNGTTETSKVAVEPVTEAKLKSLTAQRDDSSNPNVRRATSPVRGSLTFVIVSGLLVILAVTALPLSGRYMLADAWQQLLSDYTSKLVPLSSLSATWTSVTSSEPARARLIAQPSRATQGEPAPLGLLIQGRADGAVIHIGRLVPGMELTMGSASGSDSWEIPASELGYSWVAPPDGFVGSANLVAELRLSDNKIADRQTIRLEWVLPIGPGPALPQPEQSAALPSISSEPFQLQNSRTETALLTPRGTLPRQAENAAVSSISVAQAQLEPDRGEGSRPELPLPTLRQQDRKEIGTEPSTLLESVQPRARGDEMIPAELPTQLSQRQLNGDETAVLLKRGKDLITAGDLAAARLALRRAADANNAEAALALAATYDPLVLRELKVYGFTGDAAMARAWYQKAAELGSPAAPRRLEMLTQGAH
jgi:hypothetical protein